MEPMMKPGNAFTIELNQGEHLESSLFSVRKGTRVLFNNGPSLYGQKVRVFTEMPQEGGCFSRGSYRETAEVVCWLPGSFRYYFISAKDEQKEGGSGYVLVEPELRLGEELLLLECVQCVTVLSKCLGPHGSWLDRLAPAKDSGYNMIHFTPVQELGDSGSGYCLRDHLKLNTSFAMNNKPMTWEELKDIVMTLKNEWKMLTVCDIVLNHSANESSWLQIHPECTYNLMNSKHLRPAYLLDEALARLSKSIGMDELESYGIPSLITAEGNLEALRYHLSARVIPPLKLHELFMVDIRLLVSQFQDLVNQREPSRRQELAESQGLRILQDPEYRRLGSLIDIDLAVSVFNVYRPDCYDEDTRRRRCAEAFKSHLEELNSKIRSEIESHLYAAVEACIATARYFRLSEKGPMLGKVTEKNPLFPRYFFNNCSGDHNAEKSAYSENDAKLIWAHNGWVMNYDPNMDFAHPSSNVYLRRELIPWGDSVKLRYGEKEEDCPFLWSHMKNYVEQTVKVFDGVRLDNCHSTPIFVAQYMLDAARKIKPDLYVVAELFTNSDQIDNVFMNKLGITSLIRECMSGWDSHEVGRLVYRFGGDVVGSLLSEMSRPRKLAPALFLDISHDNPHPIEKRTVYDIIPSSALVSVSACATGSTFGYDQLVPHQIDVVKDNRLYIAKSDPRFSKGIMNVKIALNKLHFSLVKDGFSQVFVDQLTRDIVAVTRYNPLTLESVILFSYTVFTAPDAGASGLGYGVTVPGIAQSIILQAQLIYKADRSKYAMPADIIKCSDVINGLTDYEAVISERVSVDRCPMLQATPIGSSVRLGLTDSFKPGCVLAVRVVSRNSSRAAADRLRTKSTDIEKAIFRLELADINFALYRCDGEGGSVYHVPGYGNLVYQGLQGLMSVLEEIAVVDNLGHPLCANIRAGPWLGDYTIARLKSRPSTNYLGDLIQKEMRNIEELPAGIRPWGYFQIFSQVHKVLVSRAISLLSTFVQEGDELTRMLSLCSVQMVGEMSKLPPLCEGALLGNTQSNGMTEYQTSVLTLAAGLPHFSSGLMRCWGRDTFISLRGLLLLTGRYHEAKCHIIGFGGCLRHGLIPNLLDGEGLNPRYNCRDAIFWWLYSIKEYCLLAPAGIDILKSNVVRLYPKDDTSKPQFVEQQLSEVVQEALTVHFQGLVFRERNAGQQLDEHMVSQGFDNQIGIDPRTGFVFGGNEWNCGTWMDKMGSSIEAGTKGKPATPRDGSAVEMVGLLYSVLKWLAALSELGEYPYQGVTRLSKEGVATTWTWKEWSQRIKNSFEEEFWVGQECINQYVNRRNIYKDTCGASQEWADYRLRPNFTIAMVVAPELFNKEHAALALRTAHVLEGPLGTKTLDPSDLAYAGDYDNDNTSSDYRVAKGFNYHQGPEWLWVSGYYWRSKLILGERAERDAIIAECWQWLGRAWAHLRASPWRGLPELTNSDGHHCNHSCPTQAWSAATFLEVLYDLKALKL